MAVWSSLRGLFRANGPLKSLVLHESKGSQDVGRRFMSEHRTMFITASRFQWNKFKDVVHFYLALGLIPVGAIVFYANVFIGPAQLAEIPEGYVPKPWEYYQHPISRFLAKYVCNSHQQEYEKYLHFLYEEEQKRRLRLLEREIKAKLRERKDYQLYYYSPVQGKYARISKYHMDALKEATGDDY